MLWLKLPLLDREVEVHLVDGGPAGEVLGTWNSAAAIIKISTNQSVRNGKHTLFHEAVHAIEDTVGMEFSEAEVDAIGGVLLQMFGQFIPDPKPPRKKRKKPSKQKARR